MTHALQESRKFSLWYFCTRYFFSYLDISSSYHRKKGDKNKLLKQKTPSHNYWAHMPQLLKPALLEPPALQREATDEKPAHCNEE